MKYKNYVDFMREINFWLICEGIQFGKLQQCFASFHGEGIITLEMGIKGFVGITVFLGGTQGFQFLVVCKGGNLVADFFAKKE